MKVAVIGAGLSGLTAAKDLAAMGFKVDVFEKSRGRGGRLACKRLGWGHADTGAQYFTARDPRFVNQVQEWLKRGYVKPWSFTPYQIKNGQLFESGDDTIRYVGTPGMTAIAKPLARDLSIAFSVKIEQVFRTSGKWTLVDQSGSDWSGYDWLVVALPAKQSKDLLFDETALAEDIADDILTPCWALVVGTTGEVDSAIQGVFGDDVISWLSRISAKPDRQPAENCHDTWLLHFSRNWSLQHDKNEQDLVLNTGVSWLRSMLSQALHVQHHYLHYWRYAQLNPSHKSVAHRIDMTQKVAVIGDWCHGGRVEGAFLSAKSLIDKAFK